MWNLWKTVTGEWCISQGYEATVTIGRKEEIVVLIEELKKILAEEAKGKL